MRARDRRVHADVPRDLVSRIGLGEYILEGAVPGAVPGVSAVTLPHRLPGTELVPGQIAPRDPRPEPVDNAIHDPPIAAKLATPPASVRWQQRLDPSPLLIIQNTETRTRFRRHPSRLPSLFVAVRESASGVQDFVASRMFSVIIAFPGPPKTQTGGVDETVQRRLPATRHSED